MSQKFDLAVAAVSGGAAFATRDLSVTYIGVPLPVLLAAFAGAALILSFLPARDGGRARMLGTVILCALAGAYGAPSMAKSVAVFAGSDMLAAFVIAALTQIAVPMLIEKREDIWKWFIGFLPGRKSGEQ